MPMGQDRKREQRQQTDGPADPAPSEGEPAPTHSDKPNRPPKWADRPVWSSPNWSPPSWDHPEHEAPAWQPPEHDKPSWGAPTWNAPSWELWDSAPEDSEEDEEPPATDADEVGDAPAKE